MMGFIKGEAALSVSSLWATFLFLLALPNTAGAAAASEVALAGCTACRTLLLFSV